MKSLNRFIAGLSKLKPEAERHVTPRVIIGRRSGSNTLHGSSGLCFCKFTQTMLSHSGNPSCNSPCFYGNNVDCELSLEWRSRLWSLKKGRVEIIFLVGMTAPRDISSTYELQETFLCPPVELWDFVCQSVTFQSSFTATNDFKAHVVGVVHVYAGIGFEMEM